ncbi:MAG: hypothetical protein R3B47_00060 [Bacteroidia bacterium]
MPEFENALFVTTPVEAGRFNKLAGNNELTAFLVDGYVIYVPKALSEGGNRRCSVSWSLCV